MTYQAAEYREESVVRSIDSTAREIELYIASLHRSLSIFATEERETLIGVINGSLSDSTIIKRKFSLHFPKHIAYAVSDPLVSKPYVSNLDLFGAHCQNSLANYSSNRENILSKPSIHNSAHPDTEHFDVVVSIPALDTSANSDGLLFVSFPLTDLRRLLGVAIPEFGGFELYESSEAPGSNAMRQLLSSHANGFMSNSLSLSDDGKTHFHETQVPGTPWIVAGLLDNNKAYSMGVVAIGPTVVATIALLLAGLIAHRSLVQERSSRYRTAIVLDGIESDRKRIARELHDQVLSDASHAKRLVMDIVTQDKASALVPSNRLETIHQSITEFADGIRVAIDDLYPHTLENFGVVRAIEAHVVSRCHDSPSVELALDETVDLALVAGQRLHVFRIATELIDNALAHSGCRNLWISLVRSPNSLNLRVEDDGQRNWQPGNTSRAGRGLTNIDARMIALSATGSWTSSPSGGVRFDMNMSVEPHGDN